MPRTKITFDTVREIGLTLPDVEEGTMYGSPALKVCGVLLACLPVHKSVEPESLAVRIDFDQRAGLLADGPETYYLTDHFLNHPVVLVRLSRIRIDELRGLLRSAWRFVTAKKTGTASRGAVTGNVKPVKRKARNSHQM